MNREKTEELLKDIVILADSILSPCYSFHLKIGDDDTIFVNLRNDVFNLGFPDQNNMAVSFYRYTYGSKAWKNKTNCFIPFGQTEYHDEYLYYAHENLTLFASDIFCDCSSLFDSSQSTFFHIEKLCFVFRENSEPIRYCWTCGKQIPSIDDKIPDSLTRFDRILGFK